MTDAEAPYISREHLNDIRQEAMEFAGIGFFNYRFDGVVTLIDRSSLNIFELNDIYPDPASAIGKHLDELVSYTVPKARLRAKVRQFGAVHNHESEFKTLKGNRRFVIQDSYLFRDTITGEESVQCVMRDITEQRQQQEKIILLEMEEARRQQQILAELNLAGQMQRSFLPPVLSDFPEEPGSTPYTLQVQHRYLPHGAIGGDFLDIRALDDDKVGVFLGDVMGHDVSSALVSAIMYGLSQRMTGENADPGKILAEISNTLFGMFGQSEKLHFASALFMVVDLKEGVARFANAGHPDPIMIDTRTHNLATIEPLGHTRMPALGLVEGIRYPTREVPLDEMPMILLYTDGIYEILDSKGDLHTAEWLVELLRQEQGDLPSNLISHLLDTCREASSDHDFSDDVCLVALNIARS